MSKYLDYDGVLYFKQKLDSIFGKVKAVKVNGVTIEISAADGSVDIAVPTNNNELTNGAGFQTASEVQNAITEALKDISGITFETVSELPQTGESGKIYLLSNDGVAPNVYDEYIYVNSAWEKIGSTSVDLSGYLKKTDMVAITNTEIDGICG